MRRIYSLLFLGLTLLFVSCSSAPPVDSARTNLQILADNYMKYVSEHNGKSPAKEADFKAFLVIKKVENGDQLFTSSRDQQPFKIKYGIEKASLDYSKGLVPADQAENKMVIIEEQTGLKGKRLVAYNSGSIAELD